MIHSVETVMHCPSCGVKFPQDGANIIGRKNNSLLIHFSCEKCQGASLALVAKNEISGNLITMGMLTDLDYEEAVKIMQEKPITIDEVLDIYEELKVSKDK